MRSRLTERTSWKSCLISQPQQQLTWRLFYLIFGLQISKWCRDVFLSRGKWGIMIWTLYGMLSYLTRLWWGRRKAGITKPFLFFNQCFQVKKSQISTLIVSSRLSPISRSRTRFLFHLLSTTDEATLAPFRLFKSIEVLVSFRELIGSISTSSAELLLLLCSSGHRFFEHTALIALALRG